MEERQRTRLETEALIVGYAMSRLDADFLRGRGCATWQEAFREAARALSVPPASVKHLRDEFDPFHPNSRLGRHRRELRPNRRRILEELGEVSDDALRELAGRILAGEKAAVAEAVDALAVVTRVPGNVAERLLTGRRAEDYFLENCRALVQTEPSGILDMRLSALGFDFGLKAQPEQAIEVKGLKQTRGDVLSTDREWLEAKRRRENYRLIVVANLATTPIPKIITDPYGTLAAVSSVQTTVSVVWRSSVSVSG